LLIARSRIVSAIRRWFEGQGFIEVDTSILQVSPGNETHLHAFSTSLIDPDGTARTLYLHTSPEFACKKLLAAGEEKIFTLAPVFRNRERGALHHPCFTMLEWYRAQAPYETLMHDCAALIRLAAEVAGTGQLRHRDRSADAVAAPDRLTVAEAFRRYAGIDLLATLKAGAPHAALLAAAATASGVRVADDDTWEDTFSRVLVAKVEPHLGNGRVSILDQYPAQLAALARPNAVDRRVADRFELYACGVELANAFAELTDPSAQLERLQAEMDEKQRRYGERYPIDADFIAALAHMPPAAGAALGLDRLVMLATGASRIAEVLWAPLSDGAP
jgi:elongation factor P--(R)-beta-lysine ligase